MALALGRERGMMMWRCSSDGVAPSRVVLEGADMARRTGVTKMLIGRGGAVQSGAGAARRSSVNVG